MSDLDMIFGGKPKHPESTQTDQSDKSTGSSTSQSTAQSTGKSSKRATSQSAPETIPSKISESPSQLVSQPTSRLTDNKIVDRPKAFYILERVDKRIDEAVRLLQEQHNIKKADRSIVLNAYLDNDDLWTDEAIGQLVDRVISQLTSRLMG